MKDFSHPGTEGKVLANLNKAIESTLIVTRNAWKYVATLESQLDPELPPVLCLQGEINQVILNLVVNAAHAIEEVLAGRPAGSLGLIRVSTRQVGQEVRISVADDGPGIADAVLERMFEPFFTTKAQGKGTGLGLSTVFGIVQQSGGTIWVYSELGKGTTFKLYFPQVQAALDVMRAPALGGLRGAETVLLVEDDDLVRGAAKRILSRHGYQVVEANGAEAALRVCADPGLRIDLLVSDVVMPLTSGPELARRLERDRPGMRVLFMSGYTDDSVVRHGALRAEAAYLQKPLTTDGLLRKVREVLDQKRSDTVSSAG